MQFRLGHGHCIRSWEKDRSVQNLETLTWQMGKNNNKKSKPQGGRRYRDLGPVSWIFFAFSECFVLSLFFCVVVACPERTSITELTWQMVRKECGRKFHPNNLVSFDVFHFQLFLAFCHASWQNTAENGEPTQCWLWMVHSSPAEGKMKACCLFRFSMPTHTLCLRTPILFGSAKKIDSLLVFCNKALAMVQGSRRISKEPQKKGSST